MHVVDSSLMCMLFWNIICRHLLLLVLCCLETNHTLNILEPFLNPILKCDKILLLKVSFEHDILWWWDQCCTILSHTSYSAPLQATHAFYTGLWSRRWKLHIKITVIDEDTFVNTFWKNFHFPFIDLFFIFTTFGCFYFNVRKFMVQKVSCANIIFSIIQHFQQLKLIRLYIYNTKIAATL